MPNGLPPLPPGLLQPDTALEPALPPLLAQPPAIGPALPPPVIEAAPVPLPPPPITSPEIPTALPPLPGLEEPTPASAVTEAAIMPEQAVEPAPLGELTPELVQERLAVPEGLSAEQAAIERARAGAELVGERQAALAEQQRAAQAQYQQRQQELLARAQSERADLLERQQRAKEQIEQDRDRLRQLRAMRGEVSNKQIAGAVAVAALQAAKALFGGGPPDPRVLAGYFDKIAKDQAAAIQDAAQQVAGSEEALAGAVESQRRLEGRTELARAEMLQELQLELQGLQNRATSDAQAIQYAQAADMAGAAAAQSMEAARRANEKAEIERRKSLADIRLTEAKATEAEADATKALRAGAGRPRVEKPPADVDPELAAVYAEDPKAAERIRQRGVRDPFTGRYLRTAGGQFGTERDPAAAKKLQDRMTAATNVHRILSELIAIRDRAGWEPDFLKSGYWQRAQSLRGQLTGAMKNVYETGALDEGVVRLVDQLTGGDPTQVRDITPSLRALGKGIEDEVNIAAQGAMGQLDQRWTMPLPRPGAERKATVENLAAIAGASTDIETGETVPTRDRMGALREMYEKVISERAQTENAMMAREKATEALITGAETLQAQAEDVELPAIAEAMRQAKEAGDKKRLGKLRKARREVLDYVVELEDLIIERSAKLKEAIPRRKATERAVEILGGPSEPRPVRPPVGRPGVE